MISYKLKNWTASDSEMAAIGGFHVMFFFLIPISEGPIFGGKKMETVNWKS